jgi:peptidyl-prolyl cis-trans isomerase D
MSIIQQIREKAAWLVFGLIALSLVGFLLMDAFVGRSRLFGTKSTTVGVINGDKIEYVKFMQEVSGQEDRYKAQGMQLTEPIQQSIRENVWKQTVEESLLQSSYEKLGIEVSEKEVNDMLVGNDAIPEVRKAFTDPSTGIFDAQRAATEINAMRTLYKSNKRSEKNWEQARQFFEEGIPQITQMRMKEKYISLLANSFYVPKWMIEKGNADNSKIASISYVNTPYITVSDSAVKVSDDEISAYVNDHKDQFKQEESRAISYVTFNDAPSSPDSAKTRQQLVDFEHDFQTSDHPEAFLARVGSETPYLDDYLSRTKIQVPFKDSIFALPKGGLFGPYLDGGSYVIAKKIDEKTAPDSVRARHILVAMVDLRTKQPTLDDSTAKRKIDSIKNLIDKGARFDSVATHNSDDASSAVKGGDLGYFVKGAMVPEFDKFSFEGKKGDKKIVKSQFGYHYIEIVDQKAFQPNYKIAYLSRKIETSPETDQSASGLANKFAGESRNQQAFDDDVQKGNLQKLSVPEIAPIAYDIPGLGSSRQFVQWVYGASIGDVSEPYTIGDKYVVALVTAIYHEGLMSVAKARPLVEPILRNRKKADIIIKKLGTPASLQAAAASSGQNIVKVDSIQFAMPFIPNAGPEPKVVGAAFDAELAGKPASSPIPGNGGVFVIKVESIGARSNPNADIEQQRSSMEQQQKQMIGYQAVETLKKFAKIEDDRSKFF